MVRFPLFLAVWSSWTNGTWYHELHGTNDVSARVFTFGQMLAVAVMAVFIGAFRAKARWDSRWRTRRTVCC